ncbi:hypothetical protein DU472_04470 [Campylobacter novaezeelandiae]|uniref:hypothetical protein n=1 Tax=Campylobacter novaezeelandiae TaxID=2267891 RepID=UPI001037894B|nr:hypothetical protein [Campylobacter novaezeelandiae]TBR80917.1 hypothetical protein DU472_04470 [Campylobacter novaezeelandiae]
MNTNNTLINIIAELKKEVRKCDSFGKYEYPYDSKNIKIELENEENEESLNKAYSCLQELLEISNYDLSKFDTSGIRIVIIRNNNYFDEKSESIKFRFNKERFVGVFHNYACDKHKPFSQLVWKLWTYLHEKIDDPMRLGA